MHKFSEHVCAYLDSTRQWQVREFRTFVILVLNKRSLLCVVVVVVDVHRLQVATSLVDSVTTTPLNAISTVRQPTLKEFRKV